MAIFKGGKGRDTFIGGDKADRFEFAPADLTRDDTVVGGAGIDTLAFTARGKITAAALAGVGGIERIELADGGASIVLTQQLATTGTDGLLTVVGGDGRDTIDARQVAEEDAPDGEEATAAVTLIGGAGDDTLLGGDDGRLVFDGGAGHDTVTGVRGTVVYDGADRRQTLSGGGTLRVLGAAAIDLTRSGDQSLGDRCVTSGFYGVNASGSTEAVVVTAGRYQSVIGGKAADQITGATHITGGGGADTLVGSETDATYFDVHRGDFVRGESIQGRSGSDTVVVFGTADLSRGSIQGVGRLSIVPGDDGKPATATISADQAMALTYVQGQGDVVIELGHQHTLDLRYLHYGTTTDVDVIVHGSAGADTIDGVELTSSDARGLSLTIEGGDGDDMITADADAVLLDGGAGVDTLRLASGFGPTVEIDLARASNQGVAGVCALTGFENVTLAYSSTVTATIHGSAEANEIHGS